MDGGSLPVVLGVHELQHFFGGLHESIHVSRFEVRCDLENELGIQRLQSHCCHFLHDNDDIWVLAPRAGLYTTSRQKTIFKWASFSIFFWLLLAFISDFSKFGSFYGFAFSMHELTIFYYKILGLAVY